MVVNGGVESVVLKARLGSDMRKLTLHHNHDLAYNDLLLMMQRIFKLKASTPLVLKYRDQEGDLITLTDDGDVGLALRTEPILRVEVMEGGTEGAVNATRTLHNQLLALKTSTDAVIDSLNQGTHHQPDPPAVFGVGSRSRPDTPTSQHETVAPVATIQPTVHEQVNNPSHPPPPTEFNDIPLPPFSAAPASVHAEVVQAPIPPVYQSPPTSFPQTNAMPQAIPVFGVNAGGMQSMPQPPSMSPSQGAVNYGGYAPSSMPNSIPSYGSGPMYGGQQPGFGDHPQPAPPQLTPQATSAPPSSMVYSSMAPSAPPNYPPASYASPPMTSYVPTPPTSHAFGGGMPPLPPSGMAPSGGANPFARGASPGAPHHYVRPAFNPQQQQH